MDEDRAPSDAGDDAELVRRFRAGDETAFRALHDRYGALLTERIDRRLPGRLRRKLAVSDVLQESLLAAHEAREEVRSTDEQAFRSWLLTIADNKVLDAVRRLEQTAKRDARREVTRVNRAETSAHAARQASPSQAAVGAELHSLAQHALRRLPTDYREVLRLAQEEHLPLGEAAERMGRSREATKKLYGRALAKFREEFERLGGGSP